MSIRGIQRGNSGERVVAFALLVLGSPLMLAVALWVLVVSGRPVLHRGTRLGRDRRPFRMLKLRTLIVGAENVTGGDLLGNRQGLTILGGRFLRDTRLDELPQLWNVVRGEMSFLGPRPERPEVRAEKCIDIPGYERRFEVRPGLIGISQLCTPHGTPKRYRTLLDNGFLRRDAARQKRVGIVLFTTWAVLREVVRRLAHQGGLLWARLSGSYREKRRFERVVPSGAIVELAAAGAARPRASRLVDMNPETILLECEYEAGVGPDAELLLAIPVAGKHRPARRTARCSGRITERRRVPAGQQLVIRYHPATPRSEYMIHQYFLRDSLAVPRPVWDGPIPPALLPAASPGLEPRTLQVPG
jgi:lipopolysaccharide/colanic/teichoic acid biosynthesis glycosyltransferase